MIPINHILSPKGIDMLNGDIQYDKEEIQEIKDVMPDMNNIIIEDLLKKLLVLFF